MITKLLLPLVFVLAAVCSSCAGAQQVVQDACAKATPALVQAQSLAQNSADSLAQAQAWEASVPFTADQKAKFDATLAAARDALYAANAIAAGVALACKTLDLTATFGEFATAWGLVKDAIAAAEVIFAKSENAKAYAAAKHPVVRDPVVFKFVQLDAGVK